MRLATLGLAFLAAVSGLTVPASGQLAAPKAELVQEGPGGFTVRIQVPEPVQVTRTLEGGESYLVVGVPGCPAGSSSQPGAPDLPQKGFAFGLPDGATARITAVRTLASETFRGPPPIPVPERRFVPGYPIPTEEETFDVDASIYEARALYPPQVAELGRAMGWRHQRVQSVIIHPVRVVPGTGAYEVVREIEIEVAFRQELPAPDASPRVRVFQDAPGWDQIVDKALINPASARTFRTRSVPRAIPPLVQPGDVHVRIRLGATGLCRVPFADVAVGGFPSGVAVADVRLEERGFDDDAVVSPFLVENLPRKIEDTNANGVFDDGDFLVFYGFNYRDRFDPPIAHSRFSYFHAYWLTHSPGGGRDFPVVDGFPAGTYTSLPSFRSTARYEENLVYTHNPKDAGGFLYPVYDTHYWLESDDRLADLPFQVQDADPTGNYRVRARWQGKDLVSSTREHIVSIDINGQTILDEFSFFERFEFLWTSPEMPLAGVLFDGTNAFTMRARTVNPNNRFYGAYFDWFEIGYDRLYRAHDDELRFNTGSATGNVEMTVTGFSSPDILVFETTDPANVQEVAGRIEDAGGSWTVTVRTTASTGTPRSYVAMIPGTVSGLPESPHPLPPDLENQAITPGFPRDLLAEGNGSDYILITHPNFKADWQALVDHRESGGYQVFVADVWEIYDQFAGGDKTPWAIQRFLREAFRNWDPTPSIVLLGGDGSEDYRTDTPLADPDWIPTMMHFANVPGTAGLELAGSDTWYVQFLREGELEDDVLMDMHIGRIPVGTVQETRDAAQKIIEYETMNPTDDWRNRGIFLADDQYSNRIYANAPYCWQSAEASFKNTSVAVCDSIHDLGRLPDFRCQPYFLADHLDTVETLYRNPGTNDCPEDPNSPIGMLIQTRSYVRSHLTSAFLDSLSQGWLIWEFTGHANKNLIVHEGLLEKKRSRISTDDFDLINNTGKPFLFMGYACHLMEFEYYREKDDDESIGDVLLLAPNRGAVAVFASTGYEWLHTNPVAQVRTSRPLFWDLPRDPDGRPRRLFGEAMSRGMIQLAIEESTRPDILGMLRTYQVFGDPALRVDAQISRFLVEVDGVRWNDGDPLSAPSVSDSITVSAIVSDDVDVSSIRVLEGGAPLSTDQVTVTPPGSGEQGAQFYQVDFSYTLRLGSYDLVIEASDWAGRVSRFVMPVTLGTRFSADGNTLTESGINEVDPAAKVQIEVSSPVPLDAGAFRLIVDEVEIPPVVEQVSPTRWLIQVGDDWQAGQHTVELLVDDGGSACYPGDCPVRRAVTLSTDEGPIQLDQVYFYPNPVEAGGGSLVYNLSRNAISGELTVYSVSGRRILRRPLDPGALRPPQLKAGRNSVVWDLRDGVGDEVANGVYLVVLTVKDVNGQLRGTQSEPIRIAVTR